MSSEHYQIIKYFSKLSNREFSIRIGNGTWNLTSLWRKLPNIIILVRVLYLNFGPSLFIKRDTCLR